MQRFMPNSMRSIGRAAGGFRYGRKMSTPRAGQAPKFSINLAGKKEYIGGAFGKYVPRTAEKQLKHFAEEAAHGHASDDKDVAFFGRQFKKEGRISSKDDIKKFTRGFLKEAHEEGMKLREGYNAPGHEYEQAQKFSSQAEKKYIEENTPPPVVNQEPRAIDSIRQRLNIAHGPQRGGLPTPTMQEPTPLGSGAGWTHSENQNTPATPPPKAPTLSPLQSFTFGHISHDRQHDQDSVVAPGQSIPPAPTGTTHEPQPSEPAAPPPSPSLPDTSKVDRSLPF